MSSPMSAAGAECVSAPTLITSMPARASVGDAFERDAAGDLDERAALARADGLVDRLRARSCRA